MSISTIDSAEDRKENLKKLKDFHKSTIESLGITDYYLLGKMAYLSTKREKIVSFFHSEISKGEDIYIEFTNRFNIPEDPDRTLYVYRFNPHFQEEYENTGDSDLSKVRYIVPVDELKIVKRYSPKAEIKTEEETKTFEDFSLPDPETDPPLNEMTIRDLAAILLQKPVSKKQWLNELLK